jgi:hypothetical protein
MNQTKREPFTDALIKTFVVLSCGGAALVIGFCFGGAFYAPLFGSHAGHGLGDMLYLFVGALLGLFVGLGGGGYAITSWPEPRYLRLSYWAIFVGAATAGLTWLKVMLFGGW